MSDPTETTSSKSRSIKKNDGTTYYVREAESVTQAVVRAVGAEKECNSLEIEPLYSVIETDALDTLFAPQTSDNRRMANKTLAFSYNECDIEVTDNREVIIKKGETE